MIIAGNRVNPRNRPKRASTKPAHVPITTEANAVIRADRNDSHAARDQFVVLQQRAIPLESKSRDQTVTSFDSLNEYTTRLTIGIYRNRNPNPSTYWKTSY